MNKAVISTVNHSKFITLPFLVFPDKLALESNFSSEFIVPVAINNKFVILDGNTVVELPEQIDIESLFQTIRPSERDGYSGFHFSVPGVFYGEVYTTDEGIVCDIYNSTQTEVIETSYIFFTELVQISEEYPLNEGDTINLNDVFAKMIKLDDFSFENNFNTILTVACVDIDLENDSCSALLIDKNTDEKIMGLDKIISYIEAKGHNIHDVVSASRSQKGELVGNLMFDPVLQFTLSTTDEDYDTAFESFYSEELTIDLSMLMKNAYGLLATELFV